MSLKQTIMDDVKTAMKAGDSKKVATLRYLTAALRKVEIDEKKELSDVEVVELIAKMIKTHQESIAAYEKGGRADLATQEQEEIALLQPYLPEPMSEEDVASAIEDAIKETGAATVKDMGKVLAILKPKLMGRADMGAVAGKVKQQLGV